MVEYADGFQLLRKYVIKHHPDLNFSSLDIEEVENEMLASEAEPVNVAAMGVMVEAKEGDVENVAPIADDVNVAQKSVFLYLSSSCVLSEDKCFFFGPMCFEHKTIFLFWACVFRT